VLGSVQFSGRAAIGCRPLADLSLTVRMQVNDQIIEVDDKSLVGVTQSYAASVLRNTSGTVRFLIGRERNPGDSEVARLIEQSLAEDKMREDMRQRQQDAARQVR